MERQEIKTILMFLLIFLLNLYVELSRKNIVEVKKSNLIENPRICVLMWYDKNVKNYADLNFKINQLYCQKYGYDIIKSDERFYQYRKPHFERIPLIINYFEKYNYLIWIDADAYFNYDSPPIENILKKHDNCSFIFSGDKGANVKTNQNNPQYIINSGFFICKNCEYSKNLLLKWAYSSDFYHISRKSDKILKKIGFWQDQGVLRLMYYLNIMNIRENSIVIPIGILQSFCGSNNLGFKVKHNNLYLKYGIEKPLVNHCAGYNSKVREKTSREYYENLIKIFSK